MRFNRLSNYFLLIIFLLLFSSINSFSSLSEDTNSVRKTSININPGKTISYTINSLTLDLNKSGINDQLDQINFDFSGDLSNSILYVKVLNTDDKLLNYWNPSTGTIVEGMIQIVEIDSGIILSNPITLNIEGYEAEMPAGAGFPITFLFNQLTLFNLTGTSFDFLPLPLFLSGDWAAHESTIQLIANGLSVTNSPDEFTININQQDLAQQTETSGALTWRKADGMFIKGSLNFQDSITNIDYFNLDILLHEEKNDLLPDVLTGDTAKIQLVDAGIDYLLSSSTDISLIANDLLSFKNDLTDATGQTLLDITIIDVQGTKYNTNIENYNLNTKLLEKQEEIWLSSFGKYPQSSFVSPLIDPFVSFADVSNKRILGPFITPDLDIYRSWDTKLLYAQQILNFDIEFSSFKSLLPTLFNIQPYIFDEFYNVIDKYEVRTIEEINSGTTMIHLANVTLDLNIDDTQDAYSTDIDLYFDVNLQHNWTDDSFNNHMYEASFNGIFSLETTYENPRDHPRLSEIIFKSAMSYVWTTEINGLNQGVSNLTLADFFMILNVDYALVTRPPPKDTTTSDGLSTTTTTTNIVSSQPTSSSPGFTSSAPGFTIGLTLFSIMAISIVIWNRRRIQ